MTVVIQDQRMMISPDFVEHCAAIIEKSGAHPVSYTHLRAHET